MRWPGRDLDAALAAVIPTDHSRQTIAERYIERGLGRRDHGEPWRVLDLGCGEGGSVDWFRARDPDVAWVGLDVADSPLRATRTDAQIDVYDGETIPWPVGAFDLVYCKQVLEHARRPVSLMREAGRVLRPGGYFIGSTSQLEPYHARSFWGFTPLGFVALCEDAGLDLLEVRPGIDALTLLARRLLGRSRPFERLWARWWGRQSPLHGVIDVYGRMTGLGVRETTATKLLFSGQFAFIAQLPDRRQS
jgi:SAM-dependent methyltransferase